MISGELAAGRAKMLGVPFDTRPNTTAAMVMIGPLRLGMPEGRADEIQLDMIYV